MSGQVSKNWKIFKEEFFKDHEELNPNILDYIAVEDILLEHLEGSSLEKICEKLELTSQYITSVLKEFLNVEPRKITLKFSPYRIYKNPNIDLKTFKNVLKNMEQQEEFLLEACEIFEGIQREVEKFYEEQK